MAEIKKTIEKLYKKFTNVKEIQSIIFNEYTENKENKTRTGLQVLFYPSDYAYQVMDGIRDDGETDVAVYLYIQDIIRKKTRFLHGKNRIINLGLLNSPEC